MDTNTICFTASIVIVCTVALFYVTKNITTSTKRIFMQVFIVGAGILSIMMVNGVTGMQIGNTATTTVKPALKKITEGLYSGMKYNAASAPF